MTIFWTSGLDQTIAPPLTLEKHYTIEEGGNPAEGILFGFTTASKNPGTKQNFGFTIFPNPSKGEFYLETVLEKSASLNIEIFDGLGQLVFSKKLDNLAPGKQMINLSEARLENLKTTNCCQIRMSNGEKNSVEKIVIIE